MKILLRHTERTDKLNPIYFGKLIPEMGDTRSEIVEALTPYGLIDKVTA